MVKAEKLSIQFVERVINTILSLDLVETPFAKPLETEVLMHASIRGLEARLSVEEAISTTKISIEKFLFGYAKENIVSFDAGLRMRTSVRDLSAPVDKDVSITITQTSQGRNISLATLPLHVSLDLQRLDDTFSW